MKEFFEALDELCKAKGECNHVSILEPEEDYRDMRIRFGLWHMVFLPQFSFPKPLPNLPEIFDIVNVKTSEFIPYSGIWEPVDGSNHIGTMSYLHGGRTAPKYVRDFRDKRDLYCGYDSITEDAIWRLIWRDDRYEDGTIPEEEKDYQFLEPRPLGEERFSSPVKFLKHYNLPNPLLDGIRPEDMRCEGGQPCPHEGHWWTPAKHPGRGYFKKGDVMPDYPSSQYGTTIWYRVKE